MDIGVITARDGDYHPNRRLAEAAGKKRISLGLISPYGLIPGVKGARAVMGGMENTGLPGVILPRQGAQIGESSMGVLGHFEAMNIPMVNSAASIMAAKNKFTSLRILSACRIPVPDSLFVNSGPMLYKGVESLGGFPAVAKKPSGRQGGEVFLMKGPSDAEQIISEHLEPAYGMVIQRFIPPEGRRDLRVLVMGESVCAAVELRPDAGDFRSNFHLTGDIKAATLSRTHEETAKKSAGALGLDMAGVDLIVDNYGAVYVMEVNYSPGFRGIEKATGRDIAGEIIDFAVSCIARK